MRDPASSPGPGVRVPHPIEVESYAILRSRLDTADLPPLTRAVVERVVHTSADPSWAGDLVCDEGALRAGRVARFCRCAAVTRADVAVVCRAASTGRPRLPTADRRGGQGRPGRRGIRAAARRYPVGAVGPSATPTALPSCCVRPAGCWTRRLSSYLPVGCRRGVASSAARGRLPGFPTAPNLGAAVAAARSTPCSTRGRPLTVPCCWSGTPVDRPLAEFVAFTPVAPGAARGQRRRRRLHRLPSPPCTRPGAARRPCHRRVAAVPMVSSGRSRGGDIPAALQRETCATPSELRSPPSGPHPVRRAAGHRIEGRWARGRGGTVVLLVGRGSTDPDANAGVQVRPLCIWPALRFVDTRSCRWPPRRTRRAGPLRGLVRAESSSRHFRSTGCRAGVGPGPRLRAEHPQSTFHPATSGTARIGRAGSARAREALHGDIR